ncbi:MAG: B12-binding domain-containing radical SAM protein [Elusimicrobia bacterium]|nr:B12-binding domain-containing radical SAM protein [Elusimicrobiota bacterium]
MKTKVLFVYPNVSGIRRIPLGISILSACLKKKGHTVELFDATFYQKTDTDNDRREELGFVIKVDMASHYRRYESTDVHEDFVKKIREFGPDMICISLLQDNFHFTRSLLKGIKQHTKALVVAGGIMPTLTPEFLLKDMEIDAVIIGEGEKAIVDLADSIARNGNPHDVPNMAYISGGEFIANPVISPVELKKLPPHDYSIFDEEHLWRPFIGKTWKTGYFELTRGCPYGCTFCANRQINGLYGKKGRMRRRSIDQLIDEVSLIKKQYGLTLVSFCDENFLNQPDLEEFSGKWKASVNLPFMTQTRVETVSPEKLALLKEAGCVSVSIGIESGDEEFRRTMLNRSYTNEKLKQVFKWCREAGIRTTANNIIGFPHETEEHIKKTISVNRECEPDSISIAVFAPYMGCTLYDTCVREKLIGSEIPRTDALMYESCLNFSQDHKKMLRYYFENFNQLVFSGEKAKYPK